MFSGGRAMDAALKRQILPTRIRLAQEMTA